MFYLNFHWKLWCSGEIVNEEIFFPETTIVQLKIFL